MKNYKVLENVQIIPQPQSVISLGPPLRLRDICIVCKDHERDKVILSELRNLLKVKSKREIPLVRTEKEATKFKTLFLLGRKKEFSPELSNLRLPKMTSPEGYIILSRRKKEKAIVLLAGEGDSGTFYSLQSLRLILEKEDLFPQLVIIDEPKMKIRGVIEGYIGIPWSRQGLMSTLKFMPCYKFNFFASSTRAPKASRDWRLPYSEKELAEIKEAATYASSHFLNFCYCLRPEAMTVSNPQEIKLLLAKYSLIQDIGVKTFMLLADDMPLKLSGDDQRHFKSLGKAHATLVRKVYDFLKSEDSEAKLIFCPTVYNTCDTEKENGYNYLATLGKKLPKDVEMIWTGPYTYSRALTGEDTHYIKKIMRRKPFFWDNYPVIDGEPMALILGPITGRAREIYRHLSGWVTNPMDHTEANKIPLITIADYLWNPQAYRAEASLDLAVKMVSGKEAFSTLKNLVKEYSAPIIDGFYLGGCPGGAVGRLFDYIEDRFSFKRFKECQRLKKKLPDLIKGLKPVLKNETLLRELNLSVSSFLKLAQVYTLNYKILQKRKELEEITEKGTYRRLLEETFRMEEKIAGIKKRLLKEKKPDALAALCFLERDWRLYRKI